MSLPPPSLPQQPPFANRHPLADFLPFDLPGQVQGRLQQVRAVDRGAQNEPKDALLQAYRHRAQPRPRPSGGARQRQAFPEQKVGNGRLEASAETAGKGEQVTRVTTKNSG